MTNRAVMGPLPGGGQGLRVSRPGNDVMDPNLTGKQLAFDSRWPAAMNVDLSGTATSGATSFGKTYSVPPFVHVAFYDSQGRYRTVGADATTTSFHFVPSVPGTFAYWVCTL